MTTGNRCSARGVVLACASALLVAFPCLATELRVEVSGTGGVPLADAVVSLHASSAQRAPLARRGANMDQRDSSFVPGVLPVQVGTVVSFPNSDAIQHQVYSFSKAKRFELPLYAGKDAAPVLFDVPGVVVVGCNIHDWMIGHIVVLDTPYFARTGADGTATLQAPAGGYTLRVWHARNEGEPLQRAVSLPADGAAPQRVSLEVAPAATETRGSDRLRELQQKFRRMKATP